MQIKTRKIFGSFSFYKEMLAIAIPVMAQLLIQNLVSLVDNFMVADLGDTKMAAVNVANQINFIYFVAMTTLSNCGGFFISQFRGANDENGMKDSYRFKAITTIILSLLYFSMCQLIPDSLIRVMTIGNLAQEEIAHYGASYLKLVSWTFLPMALSQSIGSSFRDIAKPKIPLIISVTATLINTFFNFILIYGKLGAPRLEITGAAIATNIARLVEAIVFIVYARKSKISFYVPIYKLLKVKLSLFKLILKKSGLMLLSETTWVISETITTALYNGRGGSEVVAGMSAAWALINLFMISFNGLNTSISVTIGGLLGANKLAEAKKRLPWIISGASILGIFVAALQCGSVFLIPIVFRNLSFGATTVTRNLLFLVAVYLPIWAILNAQYSISRSGGDMLMGVIADVGVTYVLFLPLALIIAFTTKMGPVEMYGIIKLTDLVKLVIAVLWLKNDKWLKNLAIGN